MVECGHERRATRGLRRGEVGHRDRHAALGTTIGARRHARPDRRRVDQPPAGRDRVDDHHAVFAGRDRTDTADRLEQRGVDRDAGAGMVAVTRRRIMRGGVDRILDRADRRPVTIEPGAQRGDRRIDRLGIVEDDLPADDIRAGCDRREIGGDPPGRRTAIRVGRDQYARAVEPGRAHRHRMPPRTAGMGQRRCENARFGPDRQPATMTYRRVMCHRQAVIVAVVDAHRDRNAAVDGLRRHCVEQDRQAYRLVARGHADAERWGHPKNAPADVTLPRCAGQIGAVIGSAGSAVISA